MRRILFNTVGGVRRESWRGREYLVAPMSMLNPGVLAGSQGPLLYTPDDTRRHAPDWDGMPITLLHPTDPATNEPLSAKAPGVLDRVGLGLVRRPRFDGKLRAEGWFDVEATRAKAPAVYRSLSAGEPLELSTGLFTDHEPAPLNSVHTDGRPYVGTARNHRPDHLAVLPGQVGACSIKDGCGVLVNSGNGSVGSTLPPGCGVLVNAFCPTGKDGGQDNSCSSREGGGGAAGGGKGPPKFSSKPEIWAYLKTLDKASEEELKKVLDAAGVPPEKIQFHDRFGYRAALQKHLESQLTPEQAVTPTKGIDAGPRRSKVNFGKSRGTRNDWAPAANAFCPTGSGGGQDNTCSSTGGPAAAGASSAKAKAAPLVNPGDSRQMTLPAQGLKPARSPRYHKGSVAAAMTAAVQMSAHSKGAPVYMYPSYGGMQVTGKKPAVPTGTKLYEYRATHDGENFHVTETLVSNALPPVVHCGGPGSGVPGPCPEGGGKNPASGHVGKEVAWKSGKQTVMGNVLEDTGTRLVVRVTSFDRRGGHKIGDKVSVLKDAVQVMGKPAGNAWSDEAREAALEARRAKPKKLSYKEQIASKEKELADRAARLKAEAAPATAFPGAKAPHEHAHEVVEALAGPGNQADVLHVRAALAARGITDRKAQDEAVNDARRAGLITGSAYEGRVKGVTPEQQAAALPDPGSGTGRIGWLHLRKTYNAGGWPPVANGFCPTGPGGGSDNSCSSHGEGGGAGGVPKPTRSLQEQRAALERGVKIDTKKVGATGTPGTAHSVVYHEVSHKGVKIADVVERLEVRHITEGGGTERIVTVKYADKEKYGIGSSHTSLASAKRSIKNAFIQRVLDRREAQARAAKEGPPADNLWSPFAVANGFCPTGKGGGQDNSCSSREGKGGAAAATGRDQPGDIKKAIGGIAGGIREGFIKSAWERLARGKKLLFSENPNTAEGKLQRAHDAGKIKSEADVRKFIDAHSPKGGKAAPTPAPTPGKPAPPKAVPAVGTTSAPGKKPFKGTDSAAGKFAVAGQTADGKAFVHLHDSKEAADATYAKLKGSGFKNVSFVRKPLGAGLTVRQVAEQFGAHYKSQGARAIRVLHNRQVYAMTDDCACGGACGKCGPAANAPPLPVVHCGGPGSGKPGPCPSGGTSRAREIASHYERAKDLTAEEEAHAVGLVKGASKKELEEAAVAMGFGHMLKNKVPQGKMREDLARMITSRRGSYLRTLLLDKKTGPRFPAGNAATHNCPRGGPFAVRPAPRPTTNCPGMREDAGPAYGPYDAGRGAPGSLLGRVLDKYRDLQEQLAERFPPEDLGYGIRGPTPTLLDVYPADDGTYNAASVWNAFCPTGPGGGQDNSCSAHGEGGAGGSNPPAGMEAIRSLASMSHEGSYLAPSTIDGYKDPSVKRAEAVKYLEFELKARGLRLEPLGGSTVVRGGRGATTGKRKGWRVRKIEPNTPPPTANAAAGTVVYRLGDATYRLPYAETAGGCELSDAEPVEVERVTEWKPVAPAANAKDDVPSDDLPGAKACKILKDGAIRGKPLTDAQRGMFGAACGKWKKAGGAPTKNATPPVLHCGGPGSGRPGPCPGSGRGESAGGVGLKRVKASQLQEGDVIHGLLDGAGGRGKGVVVGVDHDRQVGLARVKIKMGRTITDVTYAHSNTYRVQRATTNAAPPVVAVNRPLVLDTAN